jgi:hypothetical protein
MIAYGLSRPSLGEAYHIVDTNVVYSPYLPYKLLPHMMAVDENGRWSPALSPVLCHAASGRSKTASRQFLLLPA